MSETADTNHAAAKTAALNISRKSVTRINDYWAARGFKARATLGKAGEIVSSVDVTTFIPKEAGTGDER